MKINFDVIFFDLDETLYPKSNGLWNSISIRINQFMTERMKISTEAAHDLRQRYLDVYGTTLNGLMQNHDIDPLEYLDFVHEIPIDQMISADPDLRQLLLQVKSTRYIFTNANKTHAERVLAILNVQDLFDGIIDIIALEYVNKPLPGAYERALQLAGDPNPVNCMIIDDRAVNLYPAKNVGMTTVLIGDETHEGIDYSVPTIHTFLDTLPDLK